MFKSKLYTVHRPYTHTWKTDQPTSNRLLKNGGENGNKPDPNKCDLIFSLTAVVSENKLLFAYLEVCAKQIQSAKSDMEISLPNLLFVYNKQIINVIIYSHPRYYKNDIIMM